MSNSLRDDLPSPPSEWDHFCIADKFSVRSGATPLRTLLERYYHEGTVPWVKTLDLNEGMVVSTDEKITVAAVRESSCEILPPNTVLVAMYGGWLQIGRTAVLGIPAATNQAICGLKLADDSVDPAYLLRFLQAYRFRWKAIAGSTRKDPNITKDDVIHFQVAAPPLPQQRKIARILTTVDNLIEKTESLIAKYQAIKQGMMHDLFTRGVDEHGHLRPPYDEAPQLYKPSELGWIPQEWDVRRVNDVGSVKLGRQRSPKHQSGRFTTPYLRVANVFDGFIDFSDVLEMDFTPTEKDAYSLLPGDILLNEGQSLELVGRSAMYEDEPHRFCFQNTLIRFRAYTPHNARFCRGVFKYYIDIGKFMTIARQTTSVAHLGADRLAKLVFPCPDPGEQHRIADALLQHEKRCDLDRKYLNSLLQTKAGLMQDLLTGKVRVNLDEAEEVAAHA